MFFKYGSRFKTKPFIEFPIKKAEIFQKFCNRQLLKWNTVKGFYRINANLMQINGIKEKFFKIFFFELVLSSNSYFKSFPP